MNYETFADNFVDHSYHPRVNVRLQKTYFNFSKVATTDPRATDGEDETDQRPRKNDVFADRARTCNELLRRTANKLHELITIWKRKLAGIVRFCTMRLHWKQI